MFERDAIRNLQRYLRQLSYHNENISPAPIDGIWDTATKKALSEFQSYYGLPITGRADSETWAMLLDEYNKSIKKNSLAVPIYPFPRGDDGFDVGEGDSGLLAEVIIYILAEISQTYGFPVYADAKVIDRAIADVIADFQRRNFLEDSGRVDRSTWDALARDYNNLIEQ